MLHNHFKKIILACTACMLICVTISANNAFAGGGDNYKVYLNKKLILSQEHVTTATASIGNLPLDNLTETDEVIVQYTHCGETGKGRSIVLKDEKGNVLKEWKFADVASSSMIIPVKDILAIKKKNPNVAINLYYFSSRFLPNGRMLATLKTEKKDLAKS